MKCPVCGSRYVRPDTSNPQDRWCIDCGHVWNERAILAGEDAPVPEVRPGRPPPSDCDRNCDECEAQCRWTTRDEGKAAAPEKDAGGNDGPALLLAVRE